MTIAAVGVEPGQEERAEDGAAERDLVDERGHDRVEERARVRPDVREPEAAVAVEGDAHRDRGADRGVQQAEEDRLAAIAGPEREVGRGRRMDDDRSPRRAPARSRTRRSAAGTTGAGRRPASSYSAALNRDASSRSMTSSSASPSAISVRRVGIRSSMGQRVRPVRATTTFSPRPSGASPGTPPAGSRPSRPASSAACLLSASRAASASG